MCFSLPLRALLSVSALLRERAGAAGPLCCPWGPSPGALALCFSQGTGYSFTARLLSESFPCSTEAPLITVIRSPRLCTCAVQLPVQLLQYSMALVVWPTSGFVCTLLATSN